MRRCIRPFNPVASANGEELLFFICTVDFMIAALFFG